MIGGVAGGLGEYLNIDPVILRIVFVIITIINGLGLLLYIILWIVIPEAPFEKPYSEDLSTEETSAKVEDPSAGEQAKAYKTNNSRVIFGIILIIIGALFLFDKFMPSFDFEDFLPIALIGLGAVVIWKSVKKDN